MLKLLEKNQIKLYLFAFIVGSIIGITSKSATLLENTIELALGILLYTMFCQLPFPQLLKSLAQGRFIIALLLLNFILIPILVWGLVWFLPDMKPLRLGVYLVLLTPCVDYVIFFTQIGQGDAKLILVSTPLLLLMQIILLPVYIWLFMGNQAINIISTGPFMSAFLWLIVIPLFLALITELWAKKSKLGKTYLNYTAWFPVPMMAIVLLLVASSQIGKIYGYSSLIMQVIPIYISYMLLAGLLARGVALLFGFERKETIALLFSGGTRNSLVILPLALALPEAWQGLAMAIIVTQTMIELIGELIYVRIIPSLISKP